MEIENIRRDADCVFCDIVHGDGEAHIIHQDERVTAFLDIQPVNPGHTLVIPNAHAASIREVGQETCGRMFVIGREVDQALRATGLHCDAVNLYLADGRAAGQIVFHAHLHVIPRYPGDSSGLHLHASPPRSPSSVELADHAAELSQAFNQIHRS